MTIFDFLYYCIYRLFKLMKRTGVSDEYLAARFYSILLSTNSLMLFFLLRFTSLKYYFKIYPYNYLLKILMLLVFVFWYFFNKIYFFKKTNYLRIINHYEIKKKYLSFAIIGIIYSIITFAFFIILANLK